LLTKFAGNAYKNTTHFVSKTASKAGKSLTSVEHKVEKTVGTVYKDIRGLAQGKKALLFCQKNSLRFLGAEKIVGNTLNNPLLYVGVAAVAAILLLNKK
jgi:hypothetical protein